MANLETLHSKHSMAEGSPAFSPYLQMQQYKNNKEGLLTVLPLLSHLWSVPRLSYRLKEKY